jgi:hypothetical protein
MPCVYAEHDGRSWKEGGARVGGCVCIAEEEEEEERRRRHARRCSVSLTQAPSEVLCIAAEDSKHLSAKKRRSRRHAHRCSVSLTQAPSEVLCIAAEDSKH